MKLFKIILVLMVVLSLALAPAAALAAKGKDDGGPSAARQVWNTIWMFINFFILVFVLVKYGRKPLMNFLAEKRVEIAENLEKVQDRLTAAEEEFKEAMARLDRMEDTIGEIEDYMRQDAERTRDRILEDAKAKAALTMSEAKERAETALKNAYAQVREELVNLAARPEHLTLLESLRDKKIDELRRTEAGFADSMPATKAMNP